MDEESVGLEALALWSVEHLDYAFVRIALLHQALTHRSVAQDEPEGEGNGAAGGVTEPVNHNERMEFLGDAVLDLAVSSLLYDRHPAAAEGELTHWRAILVNTRSLSLIARELELGVWLRLGRGEEKCGGREKESILGNSLEAVFGAVFLDGGWPGVMAAARGLFRGRVGAFSVGGEAGKDFKTLLQERLQGAGAPLPRYALEEVCGAPHERRFCVACRVNDTVSGRGEGRSIRKAEQEAAREALSALNQLEQKEPA